MRTRYRLVKLACYTGLCLLQVVGASAGEKVRFGPSPGTRVQTQPERSVRESLGLRPAVDLNQRPDAVIPMSGPATVAVPARVSREDDADHQDWIFRDTRSSAGVRKALGVDAAEKNLPTAAERDSVVVIQEYFSRQKAEAAEMPAAWNLRTDKSGSGLIGNPGNSGLAPGNTTIGDAASSKAGTIFGESSFRNTLNSENSAVRRYFRELYANPNSPGPESKPATDPAAGVPIGMADVKPAPAWADSTRSPSFQDLANRAAFIDSLTPAATLSPGFGPAAPVIPPNPSRQEAPTVNNGTLYERRNGRIEIPSRRF